MGFIERNMLFRLHRSHCLSVSRSHFACNWDEQLAVQKAKTKVQCCLRVKLSLNDESLFDSLDFFHFPKREKSVCLPPFHMKHNYRHNLMPVTFELASLMSMPSYWLAHTPCRVQSTVEGRQRLASVNKWPLSITFLKSNGECSKQCSLTDSLLLHNSDKELIFKTGHIHILTTFMVHISLYRCHISSFCNVLFKWTHKARMYTKLKLIFSKLV